MEIFKGKIKYGKVGTRITHSLGVRPTHVGLDPEAQKLYELKVDHIGLKTIHVYREKPTIMDIEFLVAIR